MTYLGLIELRLDEKNISRTAEDVMDDMRHLHYVLTLKIKGVNLPGAWGRLVRPKPKSLSALNHRCVPERSYSPCQHKRLLRGDL